jgi:hypothetical protein
MIVILDTTGSRQLKRELDRLFSEVALMVPTPPTIITVSWSVKSAAVIIRQGDTIRKKRAGMSKLQLINAHANEIKTIAVQYAASVVISASHLVREHVSTGVYESVAHFARSVFEISYPDTEQPRQDVIEKYANVCKRIDIQSYNMRLLQMVTNLEQNALFAIVRDIAFEQLTGYRYNIALDQFIAV